MNHHDALVEMVRAVDPVPDEQSPPSGSIEATFVKAQIYQHPITGAQPLRKAPVSWRRPAMAAAAAFLVVVLVGGLVALTRAAGGGGAPVPPATDLPSTSIELGLEEGSAAVAAAFDSVEQSLPPGWVAAIEDRPTRGIVDFQGCYEQPELGIEADPLLDLADLEGLLAASGLAVLAGPSHVVGEGGSYAPTVTVESLAFVDEAQAIRVQAALNELVGVGRNRICLAAIAFPDFNGPASQWSAELDEPPTSALPIGDRAAGMSIGMTFTDGPFAGERGAGALSVHRNGNLLYVVTWRDVAAATDVGVVERIVAAL